MTVHVTIAALTSGVVWDAMPAATVRHVASVAHKTSPNAMKSPTQLVRLKTALHYFCLFIFWKQLYKKLLKKYSFKLFKF